MVVRAQLGEEHDWGRAFRYGRSHAWRRAGCFDRSGRGRRFLRRAGAMARLSLGRTL